MPFPPDSRPARSTSVWLPPSVRAASAVVVRQARATVALAGLTLLSYLCAAVAFWLGGLGVQAGASAATAGAALVSLGLVRAGRVQSAAFAVSLTLAVAPIVQASMNAGVRDPALALAVLAPLAASMVLDTRTAVAAVGVIVVGVGALLALDLSGMTSPAVSSSDAVAGYTVLVVLSGAAFSVLAGALYERHTRETIEAVEARAGALDNALQLSEERYRHLVEEVPIGICQTRPDGTIRLANRHLATMLGFARPEALYEHTSTSFYVDPAEQDRVRELLARDGAVRRYPATWRTPSGAVLAVRLDARVVRDAAGEIAYYEGVLEDVTAEVRARAAVEQSEARFRALVQRSSDVTVILDRDGRFTYLSPSIERLLGHREDDLLGRELITLVHPDDKGRITDQIAKSATEVLALPPAEVRMLHREGHYLHVEGTGTSLFEDPAVQGFVVNLRDVTERHRARSALIHAKQQAEELSQLKSTFLSNMSHEIRTPLTAILGFADVLRDEITDEGPSEFVELIMEGGERLLGMLNGILDLSRMDAGQARFAAEPLPVAPLLRESAAYHRLAAERKGLALTVDAADETLLASVDPAALKKALDHLIGNAVKFTDRGRIAVGLRATEHEVHIHVRDTGTGIDPAFLSLLFTPFEQESTGAERTHEGAGLGLAIVQQVVERMDGQVRVKSRKGVGSLFTLTFPRTHPVAVRPSHAPGADRPRALVVDDDESSRFVAENALKGWYDVTTASSAEEALAIADDSFDLFVQDIYMGPNGSGEDVVRALRQRSGTQHTPIVAVTAYGLPGDRARLVAAGFDGYLRKPYTQAQMRAEVVQAIESRTGRRVATAAPDPAMLVRNRGFGDGGEGVSLRVATLGEDPPSADRPVWH